MSVNYIMISPSWPETSTRTGYYQSLKCKDSFVFACPEKDISIEEKRGCNEIGD